MTPTTIIVIAKAPVPGRVKTRLCPPCTSDEAATLAAAALDDTLDVVAATPAVARVLALDGARGPWIPPGFVIVPQMGAGLDERLANAFAAVSGPALLIGMDTPQVDRGLLTSAMQTLHQPDVDAVLGPADDGGYWAIGLREADPRVFIGVPMSTAATGAAQLARLRSLGRCVAMLPSLRDVDTFADARAVAAIAPTRRFARALAALPHGEEIAVG